MVLLAGLLNKSSLSFIFVTFIRIISIIAILLTISIEVYLIVFNARKIKNPSDGSNSSSNFDESFKFSNLSSSDITKLSGYESGSNVPKAVGGIFFFVLEQIFNILILGLCLLSEISPRRIPEFFDKFLPILGPDFGVGSIGLIQIYISTNLLSKNLNRLNNLIGLAIGWILFLIGSINLILGFTFGKSIRVKRSLLDAGSSYVKKTTHFDDIEGGFKLAKKGTSFGKKTFKNLRPSMIGRPKPQDPDLTLENSFETSEPKLMRSKTQLEITKPMIGFIDKNKFDYEENENLKSPEETIFSNSNNKKKKKNNKNNDRANQIELGITPSIRSVRSPGLNSDVTVGLPDHPQPTYNKFSRLKP